MYFHLSPSPICMSLQIDEAAQDVLMADNEPVTLIAGWETLLVPESPISEDDPIFQCKYCFEWKCYRYTCWISGLFSTHRDCQQNMRGTERWGRVQSQ
jgi:hypothetical protein